ncbi:MAG: FKBP-type peptidyl-prolyl cis-trans isomerase [Sutterella wadsworthensis]
MHAGNVIAGRPIAIELRRHGHGRPGLQRCFKGKTELSDDDMLKISTGMNSQQARRGSPGKVAKANSEKSKAYLAENAKKKGVVTTKSGLQYEVLTEGKGDKPRVEDVVTVNYVGSFIDGKEFENTWQTKEPARFVMMSVIPGLAEGVALMTPGSRYRFTVPAELAYGHDGAGQIPPESALVFDLQLVKVEKVGAHQQSFGMPGMSGGMSKEMMEKMNPHK